MISLKHIKEAKDSLDLWKLATRNNLSPISFSQISMYNQCPWKWKKTYIDKIKDNTGSIHLVFGQAMHRVLQLYIKTMYETSIVEANKLDLYKRLYDEMVSEFKRSLKNSKGNHFTTKKEMAEFYKDGIKIIDFFKKKRGVYFSKKNYELLGIEMPLLQNIEINQNIVLMGFIDVVIRNKKTEDVYIIDIKTSTRGWQDYQKKDIKKTSQILLYKKYFSKQYNIPIDKIHIQYFILKRKIWEESPYPIKRIQLFEPASGKINMGKSDKLLNEFVEHSFNNNGSENLNNKYETRKSKLCNYCHLQQICPEWR